MYIGYICKMRDNISAKVGQLFKLFAPQCCKPAPTFLNSFAQKVMKRLIYKHNAPVGECEKSLCKSHAFFSMCKCALVINFS